MPGTAFKLIAALLLCVQALIGAVRPGSTMCLPLRHGHESATCSHIHQHAACDHRPADPCEGERSPMAIPLSEPCDLGCCLHIPIPNDPQRGERPADSAMPPSFAMLQVRWTIAVLEPATRPPPQPVHDPGGRSASLRSTRLII